MQKFFVKLLHGAVPLIALFLAACGEGGGAANGTTPAVTYSVGGTLTGLIAGNSIILTGNGTDNLTLSASGVSQAFTFASGLITGAAYSLTLATTTPAPQNCTSTYGADTVNGANFTSMNVICGMMGGPGNYTGTGSLAVARANHTATPLPDGKVLVSGGNSTAGFLASAELYDPATGLWTPTGSLATPCYYHTATLLPDGKVLVNGGDDLTTAFASAELYF